MDAGATGLDAAGGIGGTGLIAADGVGAGAAGADAAGGGGLAGALEAGWIGLVAEGADNTGGAAGLGTADCGDCDGATAPDAPCAAGFAAEAVVGFAPVAAVPPPCGGAGCDATAGREALAP
ncbi:MAG: hypothetical protein ACO29W_13810 [Burkholderiaceae bacterium]